MNVEYCKGRKCPALNEKRTKTGIMYRCYNTPRNQTIRNVESCKEELFGIPVPTLRDDCAFVRNERSKYNKPNNES